MAWQDDMTTILRTLVNDILSVTYTDDSLEQVLVVSGRYVSQELTFSQRFTCDVGNIDITPDPTDDATKDESFVNMTCLKAACMLDRGEAIIAARRAIAVVDGKSSVDLTGIAKAKLTLLEKGGYCSVYDDAKLDYQSGQSRIAGAAVMTPFRIMAQGGWQMRAPGRERDLYY